MRLERTEADSSLRRRKLQNTPEMLLRSESRSHAHLLFKPEGLPITGNLAHKGEGLKHC